MQKLENIIFKDLNEVLFNKYALLLYEDQMLHNQVYNQFVSTLCKGKPPPDHYSRIPFMPISFFKNFRISTQKKTEHELVFKSSGTTGMNQSRHFVPKASVYIESFSKTFYRFYGPVKQMRVFALLPAYLEREGSSLIYMADHLIKQSDHPESGFYLYNMDELAQALSKKSKQKTLLIGVSFALLDLAEQHPQRLQNTIIMETGGMKGRRKELVREELHSILCQSFGVENIHSEYGMTELLSQAYSSGKGRFYTPPWMKVLVRDMNDPLSLLGFGKSGGINIIDLANIYSCPFIATQDLGRFYADKSFEVLGRFDDSDIRGCNLMVV